MDLDKIKESWNKPGASVHTDEDKIRDIIHGKAATALERLIMTETVFLFVVFPLIFVPFVLYYLVGKLTFPVSIESAYVVFCIAGTFWQIYKRKLLKKIDVANEGIVVCRKYFLKYKLCIKSEIIAGTVFFLLLYIGFVYSWSDIMTSYQFKLYCWLNVIFVFATFVFCFFIYKELYYKQIRKIGDSLNEIKDMEKE